MGLSSDEGKTLRSSIGRDTACRRWLVQKPRQGVAGLYFMPHEFRNGFQQKSQKEEGVQARETHPLLKGGEMLEVGEEGSSPLASELLTTLPIDIQPSTTEGDDFKQNTPNPSGVSLSPPFLNGQTDAFWQIVNAHPNALPSQIANKLHAATGRTINGAQAKALIAKGPPV